MYRVIIRPLAVCGNVAGEIFRRLTATAWTNEHYCASFLARRLPQFLARHGHYQGYCRHTKPLLLQLSCLACYQKCRCPRCNDVKVELTSPRAASCWGRSTAQTPKLFLPTTTKVSVSTFCYSAINRMFFPLLSAQCWFLSSVHTLPRIY